VKKCQKKFINSSSILIEYQWDYGQEYDKFICRIRIFRGETLMMRLLSIGIDCVSAAIFVIPALAILQCTIYRKWEFKSFCVKLIFAFYAIALFSVVGVPAVGIFQVDFGLNLIPFADIVNSPFAYMKNTILNIILFIPMGFFVPAVWKNFRSFKTMFSMGLAVSLGIELLQIFTFRLTDIDDLITNTAGTVLGYEISRRFSFPFSLKSVDSKGILVRYEPVLILAVTLLISMFLKPIVSDSIWNIMI